MGPIGVGDWVEAIENRRTSEDRIFEVGAIYEVVSVRTFKWSCNGCEPGECDRVGLRLASIESGRPGCENGHICARRFRPIRRSKDITELLETLKAPPVKVKALQP